MMSQNNTFNYICILVHYSQTTAQVSFNSDIASNNYDL